VAESTEERHQHTNKKIAFNRLVKTKEFQNWARLQAAAVEQGYRNIEEKVEKSMTPNNLKVEHVTTYTCDSCGRSETVTSTDPLDVPTWLVYSGEDPRKVEQHRCTACESRK